MRRRLVPAALLLTVLAVAVALVFVWSDDDVANPGSRPIAAPAQETGPAATAVTEPDGDPQRARVAAQDDATADRSGTAPERITGHVVTDIESDPIAGARVTLRRMPRVEGAEILDEEAWWMLLHTEIANEIVAETTTDEDGAFAFEQIVAMPIVVRAEAPGFAPGLMVPAEEFDVLISLGDAVVRRVRLLDESDEPVTAATAYLLHESSEAPPTAIVQPDEHGWLTFEAARGNEAVVVARGFASRWIESLEDCDGTALVLRPEMTIAGIVVDGSGAPISGAIVLDQDTPQPPVRTHGDGRFVLGGLLHSAEGVEIRAHAAGRAPVNVVVRPGSSDVRIVLRPTAGVAGTVLRQEGEPLRRARIEAWLPNGDYLGAAEADDEGRFSFDVLPAGPVRLSCYVATGLPVRSEHPLSLGERADVTLTFTEGERIEDFRLRLTELPTSYVFVRFVGRQGEDAPTCHAPIDFELDRTSTVRHSLDGSVYWRVVPVAPGTDLEVTFECTGSWDYERSFARTITTRAVPEGTPDDLVVPESDGTVLLRLVTTRADGRAIPEKADAHWVVSQPDGRTGRLVAGPRDKDRPPNAEIVVEAGKPLSVTAWADGCGTLRQRVRGIAAGEFDLECVLPPESIVAGRLVTQTGRPVLRAHVEVLVRTQDGHVSESVASYDEMLPGGAFEADQLAPGRGRISVFDDNFTIIAEQTFDVPGGRRVDLGAIVVGALPVVSGVVLVDGERWSGVGVEVVDGKQILAETATTDGGRFEFRVPPRRGARLVVGGTGYDLADVIARSPVRLHAFGGGELIVKIPRDMGQNAAVEVSLPDGTRLSPEWFSTPYVLDMIFVPTGPLDVTVRGERGRTRTKRVTVTQDDATVVDFAEAD